MARHLLVRLRSPWMAFGGEAIDNLGVIRDFPALSMMTGLLANALGWRREDADWHQALQDALVVGFRIDRPGQRLTDFQTAQLQANDMGWTTLGRPEERRGGNDTYKGPHLRYRDYWADADVLAALRLRDSAPTAGLPPATLTLDQLAAALDRPARPLFIGRKNCVPDTRLHAGWIDAPNVLQALTRAPIAHAAPTATRLQWPQGEGELRHDRVIELCDERSWHSGVHGGWRLVREGSITLPQGVSA